MTDEQVKGLTHEGLIEALAGYTMRTERSAFAMGVLIEQLRSDPMRTYKVSEIVQLLMAIENDPAGTFHRVED